MSSYHEHDFLISFFFIPTLLQLVINLYFMFVALSFRISFVQFYEDSLFYSFNFHVSLSSFQHDSSVPIQTP